MITALFAFALAATPDGLATDKDYKIVTTPSKLKAGAEGSLTISVIPGTGFHLSDETPFTVKLAAPEGVTLGTTQFARKDVVDPKAKDPQVQTTISAKTKGEKTLKSDLVFFLCTDKLCQRMSVKHEFTIAVD